MGKLTIDDVLLEQLERLNSDLSDEELEKELKRSDAISNIAKAAVENQNVLLKKEELEVKKDLINKNMGNFKNPPKQIGVNHETL